MLVNVFKYAAGTTADADVHHDVRLGGYLGTVGVPWDSGPSSRRGGEETPDAVVLSRPSGDKK